MTMTNIETNTKKLAKRIGKIVYYLFVIWALVVGSMGAYLALNNRVADIKTLTVEQRVAVLEESSTITKELYELREGLGYKYSVVLYRVTLETAYSPEKIDVISSVGTKNPTGLKNYWQNEPNYEGYKNLTKRIMEEGSVYIDDITEHEDIYQGDAKIDLDVAGTRSIYGMLIIKEPKEDAYELLLTSNSSMDISSKEFYYKTRQTAKNIRTILKGE